MGQGAREMETYKENFKSDRVRTLGKNKKQGEQTG